MVNSRRNYFSFNFPNGLCHNTWVNYWNSSSYIFTVVGSKLSSEGSDLWDEAARVVTANETTSTLPGADPKNLR